LGVRKLPFCSWENTESSNDYILIDTAFITSYMPECTDMELKVYLFGLYLCSNPLSKDNSLDHIKDALNISDSDIADAYTSLSQKGLIRITSFEPLQVQYVKDGNNRMATKLYDTTKYADFNIQLQDIFSEKFIVNQNDFIKYYNFIETSNIDQDAMLLIAKHCVNVKGQNVAHNYILRTAASWLNDGIRSCSQIEARIAQRELNQGNMKDIAVAIGKTSQISEEDKDLYTKWTDNWGYEISSILAASKKSYKSFAKLDSVLDDCFKNGAISSSEVEEYLKMKKKLNETAIEVIKQLGTYYDNTAPIVEEYISPWQQKGFSLSSIISIAKYCFRNSIKRLQDMNEIISNLFNMGIIADDAIDAYFNKIQQKDESIKKVLDILGSSRFVTKNDRDIFDIWTRTWGFNFDTICEVASLSQGKNLGEVARKLSILKDNSIFDKENARVFLNNQKIKSSKFTASDREFDKEIAESTLIADDNLGNEDM